MGIYLAGIDLGTTGAKATIFDHDGYPIAGAYRDYPCIYPKPPANAALHQDPKSGTRSKRMFTGFPSTV
jgi:xylulokinase